MVARLGRVRMIAATLGLALAAGVLGATPATATAAPAAVETAADPAASAPGGAQAAEDPPDLDKFQKVVLGQGTHLGEVM